MIFSLSIFLSNRYIVSGRPLKSSGSYRWWVCELSRPSVRTCLPRRIFEPPFTLLSRLFPICLSCVCGRGEFVWRKNIRRGGELFSSFSEQKIRSDTVGHFRHVDVKPKKKKKQLFSPSTSSSFVLLEPTSEAIALSG
jgi:hypothetical protein